MTAVSFADLSATSEGGLFLAEARSPDNGTINRRDGSSPDKESFGFKYRQFQGDFRYRLIESKQGKVIWEKWQEKEPSPLDLFVSDDGWVVVRHHGYSEAKLVTISPAGSQSCVVEVSPPSEKSVPNNKPGFGYIQNENVTSSTAGLFWTGGSFHYFSTLFGRPHFVLSTGWGERLVISLEDGVLCHQTDIKEVCEEHERGFIPGQLSQIASLLSTITNEEETCIALRNSQDVDGLFAGAIRNRVSVGSVNILLQQKIGIWTQNCHALSNHSRTLLAHRVLGKLLTRLMGETPNEFACYTFSEDYFGKNNPSTNRVIPKDAGSLHNRTSLFCKISLEANSEEVLAVIGAPDLIEAFSVKGKQFYKWGEHWDYFYGKGDATSSLRISWKEGTMEKKCLG